jgi:hypothetical protein
MQEVDEGLAEVHQDGTTWLQKEVRMHFSPAVVTIAGIPCTVIQP